MSDPDQMTETSAAQPDLQRSEPVKSAKKPRQRRTAGKRSSKAEDGERKTERRGSDANALVPVRERRLLQRIIQETIVLPELQTALIEPLQDLLAATEKSSIKAHLQHMFDGLRTWVVTEAEQETGKTTRILSAQLEAVESKWRFVSDQLADAQTECEQLQRDNSHLRSRLSTAEERVEELTTALELNGPADSQDAIEDARRQADHMSERIKLLMQENEDLVHKWEELQIALESSEASNRRLEHEFELLRAQYREGEDMAERNIALHQTLRTLQQDLERTREDLRSRSQDWIAVDVELPKQGGQYWVSDGQKQCMSYFNMIKGQFSSTGYFDQPKYWMHPPSPPSRSGVAG